MYELSAKVEKFDFEFLLENLLNKKLWSRSWTILEYDEIKIQLNIRTIDVEDNEVRLYVRITHRESLIDYELLWIPLDRAHYNSTVFEKALRAKVRMLLTAYGRRQMRKSPVGNVLDRMVKHLRELDKYHVALSIPNFKALRKDDRKALLEQRCGYFNADFSYRFTDSIARKKIWHIYSQYLLFTGASQEERPVYSPKEAREDYRTQLRRITNA